MLFDDEENSERYDDQVSIGRVTCGLSVLHELEGTYEVSIEEAK